MGHLPVKRSTKHVPIRQIPVGSVNARGMMKLVDKRTGHVRYVDAKKGLVLGFDGNPTPEKIE